MPGRGHPVGLFGIAKTSSATLDRLGRKMDVENPGARVLMTLPSSWFTASSIWRSSCKLVAESESWTGDIQRFQHSQTAWPLWCCSPYWTALSREHEKRMVRRGCRTSLAKTPMATYLASPTQSMLPLLPVDLVAFDVFAEFGSPISKSCGLAQETVSPSGYEQSIHGKISTCPRNNKPGRFSWSSTQLSIRFGGRPV